MVMVNMFFLKEHFALAAEVIELKLAHFMPPVHVQHQKSYVPFAQNVEKLSEGRVRVKIYTSSTLGGPLQLPDAVKTGITDIAFIFPSVTAGRFPRTSAFDLPFLFGSAVQATKVAYALYDKYLADDYKDYKVLWLYSSDTGQFYSATKPVLTLADLKGMKLRSPSSTMSEALKLLGANPAGMSITEVQMALDKHVIDGALTPNTVVADFRLADQIKHITQANVYVSMMAVVMNKQKFDSLPPFAKKALEDASGQQWGLHAAKIYDDYATETVKKLRESGKVKIHDLSPTEKKKLIYQLRGMEDDWIRKNTSKGIPARAMIDAMHQATAGQK
jgi:TRAP-type C4-dicarboxylate transport system substrate-binding protein